MNTTKPKPLLIGSQTGRKGALQPAHRSNHRKLLQVWLVHTHRVGGAVKQNRRGSCGCGFQHNVRG